MKVAVYTRNSSNADSANQIRAVNALLKQTMKSASRDFSIEYEVAVDRNGNAQLWGDVVIYALSESAAAKWHARHREGMNM